jgi:hypothetical protein
LFLSTTTTSASAFNRLGLRISLPDDDDDDDALLFVESRRPPDSSCPAARKKHALDSSIFLTTVFRRTRTKPSDRKPSVREPDFFFVNPSQPVIDPDKQEAAP